ALARAGPAAPDGAAPAPDRGASDARRAHRPQPRPPGGDKPPAALPPGAVRTPDHFADHAQRQDHAAGGYRGGHDRARP
ncbi:hypothetical protein SB717_39285, partial [Priestia sp. SIMBA_032]